MTKIDERLATDGRDWRAQFDHGTPLDLTAAQYARQPARRRPTVLACAAAAACVVAIVAVTVIASHRTGARPVPAAAGGAPLACDVPGLSVNDLPHGVAPQRNEPTVLMTAQQQLGTAYKIDRIMARWVADPATARSGLPAGLRVAWILDGTMTTASDSNGPPASGVIRHGGGPVLYPAGTKFKFVAVIDDATLQGIDSYTCRPTGP